MTATITIHPLDETHRRKVVRRGSDYLAVVEELRTHNGAQLWCLVLTQPSVTRSIAPPAIHNRG